MCMAYDYGIRDIWIVNAGDLKFNETSLAYFMELAFNFEKWGTNSPNSIDKYTSIWLEKTFPQAGATICGKMADVLHGYIKLNSLRRPEALNSGIYHPCHYHETDRMLAVADNIEQLNDAVYSALSEKERTAYYSMICFPAKASVNLLRMHLYAGKNLHYAKQGKKIANDYSRMVAECIKKDRDLCIEFALFKDGKWKGMELEQHIGFVKWNEDNCRFPLRITVEPAYKPRMVVSRKDKEEIYTRTYGNPMVIKIEDFLYHGNDEVILEIANDGEGSIDYVVESKKKYVWLEISCVKGKVESQQEIVLRCNKRKMTERIQTARLLIKDRETTVAVEIKARSINTENLPPMTFLENNGVIAMEANHFCSREDVSGGGFIELKGYGRSGCGMKVFPVTADFRDKLKKPALTYRFLAWETCNYTIEILTTPTNQVQNKRPLRLLLADSQNKTQIITVLPADFKAGNSRNGRWCAGVLNNIRTCKAKLKLEKGVREISIGAIEAGLVLERILIYKKNKPPLTSYLGPPESFYTGTL